MYTLMFPFVFPVLLSIQYFIPLIKYIFFLEYARIPSRSELTSQLQAFLRESDFSNTKRIQTPRLNLDQVINELVEQLKQMENNVVDVRSPKAEMEHAGRQIQTVHVN